MSIEEYRRQVADEGDIGDWLSMEDDDVDFDPVRVDVALKAADL